jgi:hypothetical protein
MRGVLAAWGRNSRRPAPFDQEMRLLVSVLVAVVAMLCVAAGAGASTVALQPVNFCTDGGGDCRYMSYRVGLVLRFDGELAERNRVLVRRDGNVVLVGDAGASLRPGSGCVASDAQTARCDPGSTPVVGYRLDGNDGDDVIAIAGALAPAAAVAQPRLLLGGSGADDLVDGLDASTLAGGPGADRLSGGAGDDRFFGFDFGDAVEAADRDDAASDVVDGGPGADIVDYRARRHDLDVMLSGPQPGGGESGERDLLHGVEVILGGRGDDRIIGSPAADRLEGNGGADRLRGGGGDDELIGGLGADDLRGGRGDDRLGTGRGRADGTDRVLCGPGRDVAGEFDVDDFFGNSWIGPDAADVIATDCEGVPFGAPDDGGLDIRLDARPRRRGRTWTFRNPCVQAHLRPCSGGLDLALGGERPIARVRFATTGLVTVRLSRQQARRVGRAPRVRLRITARQRRPIGRRPEAAFTLSLAPPT